MTSTYSMTVNKRGILVTIFDSRRELRACRRRFPGESPRCAAFVDRGDNNDRLRLFLSADELGAGLLAHESTHLALSLIGGPRVDTACFEEEELAEVVGKVMRALVGLLYRKKVLK